jgi:hypothetical protein
MGRLTNLNPPAPIADADIPAGIARDSEVSEVIKAYRRSTASEVMITGTVKSTAGDTGVLHGIPAGIIVGIDCTVQTTQNWRVPPGFVGTGYDYFAYSTPTHFIIYVPGSGANSGGVMGRPFNALLTYTTT